MEKTTIFSNYSLKQATFDNTNKRVAMTEKELATLRALCKGKTFDLVSLIDDIDAHGFVQFEQADEDGGAA